MPAPPPLFMEDAAQLGKEEGLFVGGGTVLPQALQGLLSHSGWKEEFNEVFKKAVKKIQRHGHLDFSNL